MTKTATSPRWAAVDLATIPDIKVPPPGPRSKEWHDRCSRLFKGLSSQVKLFPVAFETGQGCVLTDVDGNRYIDFSSGIYVTTLGHCHPKISEAVARQARQLMNAHDFTTPDQDAAGREARRGPARRPRRLPVLRLRHGGGRGGHARAAGGDRPERDALLLLRFPRQDLRRGVAGGDPFASLRPRPGAGHAHGAAARTRIARSGRRPTARSTPTSTSSSTTSTSTRATVSDVAGFVLEPIQGWGGSVMPPDDFFPKLRQFCDERKILLMADEVLTSWGRTGKWLCLEHWGVVPDVVAIGKGFGNGFPVTCVAVREPFKESFEKISRLQQLRRQPDGLRRGAGLHRGHRGGEPARPALAPSGRAGHEADDEDDGRAPPSSATCAPRAA